MKGNYPQIPITGYYCFNQFTDSLCMVLNNLYDRFIKTNKRGRVWPNLVRQNKQDEWVATPGIRAGQLRNDTRKYV